MVGYEIGMVRNDDRKTDQVFLGKGFGFNPCIMGGSREVIYLDTHF